MSHFLESEAEESEHEGHDEDEEEIGQIRKQNRKEKRKKQIDSSEEDDDEDDEEVVKDLIDDNPIEEGSDSDNESDGSRKRKKSDDEDELDDRLEDEDYDLLEENLGRKVQRKRFKKIRRMDDEESDAEETQDKGDARGEIERELFDSDNEEERPVRREDNLERYVSDESEGEYSDTDGFIVDDDGKPITEKKRRRKPIFNDAALQEAQDIFGVDFDYDDLGGFDEDEYEDEDEEDEDEYENEEQASQRRSKKAGRRRRNLKRITELYEPHELERAGITEEDNKIRGKDVPERMQLRSIPVTPADDEELEDEAEWIFKTEFARKFATSGQNKHIDHGSGGQQDDDNWDTQSALGTSRSKPAAPPVVDDDENWETGSTLTTASARVPAAAPPVPEDDNWDVQSALSVGGKKLPPVVTDEENWETTSAVGGNKTGAAGESWEDWGTRAESVFGGRSVAGDPDAVGAKSVVSVAPSGMNIVEDEVKPKVVEKIKKALEFMRNHQLEVPFIAFYRKEYIQPELDINDLWKIYRLDARYCQLRTRRERLAALFSNMRDYLNEVLYEKADEAFTESTTTTRFITEEDIDRVKSVKSSEELKDMHLLFSLYYYDDVPAMKLARAKKEREERKKNKSKASQPTPQEGEEGEEPVEMEEEPEPELEPEIKRKIPRGVYWLCKKMGVEGLVKRFGMNPEKIAENVRETYQKHEVDQEDNGPVEIANEYLNDRLKNCDEALKAAKLMLATQISREPLVRATLRETFFDRATLTVTPTKKGGGKIDESHPCFTMKYLKDKPVRDLREDQFLKLVIAEEDKLLNIVLGDRIRGTTSGSLVDEIKKLFHKDEYSQVAQEWNDLRGECIEFALENILFPAFRKELKAKLVTDAKEYILEYATKKLSKQLEVAPYSLGSSEEEEDDEWDTSKGIRVLAVAYVPDFDQAAFGCIVGGDGDPSDFVRLQSIIKNVKSFNENDRKEKLEDLEALKNLMIAKKPHVVVIGGESRDALMIRDDIRNILGELVAEEGFPNVNIEIIDNELSKVYANSSKAQADFREYPLMLRQAISLGRRLQDPLVEFSQLVNHDDEILCLRFHPLQDQVDKDDLLERLITQFVNKTNEVGVDINRCIASPFTSSVAQFICGLGPRKSTALIKTLKQNNQRLENRTQLITVCHMGPKIFINCSGFIKIDTNSLGDSTEAYVEVLDGSRVHPETYEWARKMAVDALDEEEDANPASALEEILDAPERLDELNLDAFAEELDKQGFGNKSITLYDIRAELNHRYKDPRKPFEPPNSQDLFQMLTKETAETLYIGKLTTATVIGISHKKPQGEQLDNAIPVRNEETGMWQCAFCMKNDFPDLSEVWNHFDAGACPGQATGVRVRLDNGISGFIPISKLSDKPVTNPEQRVRRGQTIHVRIVKIEVDRFAVECTSRTSDLVDAKNEWRPRKDDYYDAEGEEEQKKREEALKAKRELKTYVRRVIVHPSFRNISYKELMPMLETMDQGEAIIRPSSKGHEHLTVSWKVTDGVYHHVDVREDKKENMFSLGQALFIGSEEYEDLDEIVARFVNPMANHARDIINYKYYMGNLLGNRPKAEEYLKEEKSKNANKIHYCLHPSQELPGKFVLSYLPGSKVRHEYITITPEGFRYRQQPFKTLNAVLKYFKDHYQEGPPLSTPVSSTPKTNAARTPFATPGDHSGKMPLPPPSHFSAHPAASHTTPHYTTPAQAYTPYSAFTTHTPYTPTAQTPYITPYQTPYQSGGTPRTQGSGQFLHPGSVTPSQPAGYKSTSASSQKPGQPVRAQPATRAPGESGDEEWRKAAEAWAKSQQRPVSWGSARPPNQRSSNDASQSRYNSGSQSNQVGSQSRGQHIPAQALKSIHQFHRMMEGAQNVHGSSAHNFIPNPSPRSGRDSLKSTPRTNFSPRSMVESSLGDETPLHDEN